MAQKKKPRSKDRARSLTSWKDEAWNVFSKYIRLKYADSKGFVQCVTCGIVKFWKEMQAGHFVPGRGNGILFDERCVHPQCYRCNCILHGNLIEYFPFMVRTYGQEVIDELKRNAKVAVKRTAEWYQQFINEKTEDMKNAIWL